MVPLVARDALSGASCMSTIQTNISSGSNKCTNDQKITTLSCNDERGVKRFVITMNIRVCLRA